MKPIAEMGRADLAAFVQEHLRLRGIDVVLYGGACVAIYSDGQYLTMDLDLVYTGLIAPKRSQIREVMRNLGFSEEGRHFKHPNNDLFVVFPNGPPAVGEEPVKDILQRQQSTGILKIISPTDCVKDRLTWFYHDRDLQCLEQAVLVAQQNYIDLAEIERWSEREGKTALFTKIRERFEIKT